ncbi:MAG TPA: hypothetical protein VIO38_12055, partial [Rariglobus sp.]
MLPPSPLRATQRHDAPAAARCGPDIDAAPDADAYVREAVDLLVDALDKRDALKADVDALALLATLETEHFGSGKRPSRAALLGACSRFWRSIALLAGSGRAFKALRGIRTAVVAWRSGPRMWPITPTSVTRFLDAHATVAPTVSFGLPTLRADAVVSWLASDFDARLRVLQVDAPLESPIRPYVLLSARDGTTGQGIYVLMDAHADVPIAGARFLPAAAETMTADGRPRDSVVPMQVRTDIVQNEWSGPPLAMAFSGLARSPVTAFFVDQTQGVRSAILVAGAAGLPLLVGAPLSPRGLVRATVRGRAVWALAHLRNALDA